MNGIETIARGIDAMGRQAAEAGLIPYVVSHNGEGGAILPDPLPLTRLGNYEPAGWHRCNTLTCKRHNTAKDGPDLTAGEIRSRLRPGFGYAIIQETQFQVVVGEFCPPGCMEVNGKVVPIEE